MAGLGRKEWSPGDTLNAADVNGYLMDQTVMVFAGTAARASAIPTPSAGMVAYSTATQLEYYDGAAWEPIGFIPGLVPMVPSSVTVGSGTGAASANGQVTFTTASSVSLNGVFTSSYRNYRILFNTTAASGTGTITIRLRAAGSDITAANYLTQTLQADGSNAPSANIVELQTSWVYMSLGNTARGINAFTWDLFNPQVTERTVGVASNGNFDSGNNSRIILRNYAYEATTSADGISFIMSANNFTGTVTVYGYNQ